MIDPLEKRVEDLETVVGKLVELIEELLAYLGLQKKE